MILYALHIRSTPKLADILLSEFSDELVRPAELIDGFSDRLRGVSPDGSELLYGGRDMPGLPLVGGSLMTSTLSLACPLPELLRSCGSWDLKKNH